MTSVMSGWHQLHSVVIAAMAMGCQQVISGCCANNHQWQTTAMGTVNRLSQGVVLTTTNDRQLPWALSTGYLRVLWQQLLWAVNRLSQSAATTTTNDKQLPQGLSTGYLRCCDNSCCGLSTGYLRCCDNSCCGLSTGYLRVLQQQQPTTDNCHRQCQWIISGCCGSSCHAGLPDCVSVGAIEQTSKGVGGAQRYHSHRNLVKILSTNILHMHEKCLGWLQ